MTPSCLLTGIAVASATVLAIPGVSAAPDARAVPRIDVAGTIRLPDTADVADGTTVAVDGVSGLTWLGDDRWAAVMDTGAAFVTFALDLGADGAPRAIRDVRAVRFAARHDYEDVAPCPTAVTRRFAPAAGRCLLVCEEDTPAIRVVDGAGALVGSVTIPAVLASRRENRGLEALCLAADDGAVWTANEEAIAVDGPPPARDVGTVVRLVEVPLGEAAAPPRGRQIAYAVDPPHACVAVGPSDVYSGVVALATLPDGRLLVLERSAARCLPPFENRLYVVDPAAAIDVADVARDLAARPAVHAAKHLVWRGSLGCNLEGLSIGPPLTAGGTALVAVADAGGLGTAGQIVVLRMGPPVTSP